MLANVADFKCIVFLTVVRDWNDRKEMSRKHTILSLYKILLVTDTVTIIMMGRQLIHCSGRQVLSWRASGVIFLLLLHFGCLLRKGRRGL